MRSVIRFLLAVRCVAYICGVEYKKPVLRCGGISAGDLTISQVCRKSLPILLCGIFFW